MKKKRNVLLRILVSGIIIYFIGRTVQVNEVVDTIKYVNVSIYIISFTVFLANKLISTYRWKLLLDVQQIKVKFIVLYKLNLLGMVFNSILPSTIGGDSAKIYWLIKEHPKDKASSALATIADKILGISALIFLVIITLPLSLKNNDFFEIVGLIVITILIFTSIILVFIHNTDLVKFMRRFMFANWLRNLFDQIINSMQLYKSNKKVIALGFLLSLVFQLIMVSNQYLRFLSINLDVSYSYLFFAIPITTLIVTLPISVGGFGLREISLIGLLMVVGIERHEVISYTLVSYSMTLLLSIGLVLYNAMFGLFDSDILKSKLIKST